MEAVQTLDRTERKFDNAKRKIYISFFACNAITSNFWLARRKFTLRFYHCADSNILGKILVRLFLKYDLSDCNNLQTSFALSNMEYFYNTYILSIRFRYQSIMDNERFLHEIVVELVCVRMKKVSCDYFI